MGFLLRKGRDEMRQVQLGLISLLLPLLGLSQINKPTILEAFNNINRSPEVISYQVSDSLDIKGGHLQSIQIFKDGFSTYAFLTGSSRAFAYLELLQFGDTNQILKTFALDQAPMKHAGGFQIFENYMAIGIDETAS